MTTTSPRITSDGARYLPGQIIAGRYRMVGMLGRGGMGEVYRADDLRLGQPVALKFLPAELESDTEARERLLAEVRLARTIAHPNVCRVYDIGDLPADGPSPARTFLTMEYIDGEDLGTLLRRIGRLPPAKALEIARQLCAGLAAAHNKRVLHRDLKPANVMIDGRGHVRIADFGIAIETSHGDANTADASSGNAGTLAYMAPELFAGEPASVRSDLYALGLVLYETVTGVPAYKVNAQREWVHAHATATPTDPSVLVADVDPAVERTILRCLEKDPAKRPASATQVAVSLPGGDPLAAALAAGEMPSPELVAASGEEGTLSRAKAWRAFAAAIVSLMIAAPLVARSLLINHTALPLDMKSLERRAQETMVSLGYTTPPVDWVGGWRPPYQDSTGHIAFVYRQSPQPLADFIGVPASLNATQLPEDASLIMNPSGRLRRLDVGGTKDYTDTTGARTVDWNPLLAAIGADTPPVPSAIRRWPPAFFADTRAAWTAVVDSVPSVIEAAALRGRVVSVRIRAQDARDEVAGPDLLPPPAAAYVVAGILFFILVVLGLLARRNVRLGRGDQRGARRLAAFFFVTYALYYLLSRHWSPNAFGWIIDVYFSLLVPSLMALVVWYLYIATEPFVRQRWPRLLVGWARLLDGRVKDPVVGQGLLAGVTVGALTAAAAAGSTIVATSMHAGEYNFAQAWWTRSIIPLDVCVGIGFGAMQIGVLVVARMLFRRDWAAWSAVGLFLVFIYGGGGAAPAWLLLSSAVIMAGLMVALTSRFGLMGVVVAFTTQSILLDSSLTGDASRWYFWNAAPALLFLLAIAAWGFRNVLGNQSMVPSEALDG